jgi:putative FmdB family regulatory protein
MAAHFPWISPRGRRGWARIRNDEEHQMPIYEYKCKQCSGEFEALVRSDTVAQCPKCHSRDLEKLLSVFATSASAPELAPAECACASCGNFRGPDSCALN